VAAQEHENVQRDDSSLGQMGRHSPAAIEPSTDAETPPERNDRIGVGGGDENVAKIQLAARWAEQFGQTDDNLDAALRRFSRAYTYIDSVTKLVDPSEL